MLNLMNIIVSMWNCKLTLYNFLLLCLVLIVHVRENHAYKAAVRLLLRCWYMCDTYMCVSVVFIMMNRVKLKNKLIMMYCKSIHYCGHYITIRLFCFVTINERLSCNYIKQYIIIPCVFLPPDDHQGSYHLYAFRYNSCWVGQSVSWISHYRIIMNTKQLHYQLHPWYSCE